LEILSGLRKLQSETKKQVQKMPVIYDLTKDIRFKEGVEVGEERGEARGEERGELKKARNTAIRMLKQEEFSIVKIAELLDVPLDFVVQIQKELQRNPNLK
jgi:predicted transposase YdaD